MGLAVLRAFGRCCPGAGLQVEFTPGGKGHLARPLRRHEDQFERKAHRRADLRAAQAPPEKPDLSFFELSGPGLLRAAGAGQGDEGLASRIPRSTPKRNICDRSAATRFAITGEPRSTIVSSSSTA